MGHGRARWLMMLLAFAAACGDPSRAPEVDAGDTAPPCTGDGDCDDDLFCNGTERCADGVCVAGEPPCPEVPGCVESSARCATTCDTSADLDGDGARSMGCGGDDCDDGDPRRYPGNAEVCDAENLDEDCDPTTYGDRDVDGDGHVDARCCNGAICGEDCDDTRRGVHPDSPEVCNGIDDNCRDGVDEDGAPIRWYRDEDGDGFGSHAAEGALSCRIPGAGWSRFGTDCNDARADVSPAAREVNNGRDDDCDGRLDEPPMDVIGGGIRTLGSAPTAATGRRVVEDRIEAAGAVCPPGARRCLTGGIVP